MQNIHLSAELRWMLDQERPMMIMMVMAEPSLTQGRNYGSRPVAQEKSWQVTLAAEPQKVRTPVRRLGNTTTMNM